MQIASDCSIPQRKENYPHKYAGKQKDSERTCASLQQAETEYEGKENCMDARREEKRERGRVPTMRRRSTETKVGRRRKVSQDGSYTHRHRDRTVKHRAG